MGKKTKENRYFRRYLEKFSAKVSSGKETYSGEILDYSLDGIGLVLKDSIHVVKGDVLGVDNEDLSVHGSWEVEWSSRTAEGMKLGLHRLTPLSGFLRHFRLADILIGLQRSLRNGTLRIVSGSVEKEIFIKKGDIVFARSNQKHERLGDVLLKEGRITQSAYDLTSKLIPKTGKKQGTLLIEINAMAPTDLSWAVQHQVEEIILNLFALSDGTFEFLEEILPNEEVIHLRLPSGHLIYHGLKRPGSEEQLKDYIDLPAGTVIGFSKNPLNLFQDISFDDEDKKILSLIDGNRSIQDIVALSELDEAKLRKSLSALMNTAIIEAVTEETPNGAVAFDHIMREPEAPAGLLERIDEIYRNLSSSDYYSLLGVDDKATGSDLRTAFYRVAKEFHPDRHFYLDEDVKGKLHVISSAILKAYSTLSSPEKREEYDRSVSGTRSGDSRAEHAGKKFDEGYLHYRKKGFAEAAICFEAAISLNSSEARYYFFHGLALMELDKFRDAEKAVSKACKMVPGNDDCHAVLGQIYLRLGYPMRARVSFTKALELNDENKRARAGMQSLA
ncbi:MAG: DUF4388 domain-containing protein [Thermodesulfovibrionales bacterium]